MFTIQAKTTAQGDSKLSVIMNWSRKCPPQVEIARLAVVGGDIL